MTAEQEQEQAGGSFVPRWWWVWNNVACGCGGECGCGRGCEKAWNDDCKLGCFQGEKFS